MLERSIARSKGGRETSAVPIMVDDIRKRAWCKAGGDSKEKETDIEHQQTHGHQEQRTISSQIPEARGSGIGCGVENSELGEEVLEI